MHWHLLAALDPSDYLLLAAFALFLFLAFHRHNGTQPLSPETRAFLIEFARNNTGIGWSFAVVVFFTAILIYAMTHMWMDTIVLWVTGVIGMALGWMGIMLTGRSAATRTEDKGPAGKVTRETNIKENIVQEAAVLPAALPAEVLVVNSSADPVKVSSEDRGVGL